MNSGPWELVCSAADHRRRQAVVRTSMIPSATALCATLSFDVESVDVASDLFSTEQSHGNMESTL